MHAEQLARRLGDARSQLGAENLEDRALGPRWLAAKLARQAPQACQAHRLTVDGELGQPLAHEGIVPRGVAIARQPPRDGDEALHLSDGIARARRVALVHQRGRRDRPALIDRSQEIRLRDDDVLEEHLVEMAVAREQHERPHGDAPGRERHQEGADALVLGDVGIRPRENEDPMREVRA